MSSIVKISKHVGIILLCLLLSFMSHHQLEVARASETAFHDIGESYAKEEIKSLNQEGVVQGYGDGTFRPSQPMTRSEFAVLIARALSLSLQQANPIPIPHPIWAATFIQAATHAGIMEHNEGQWHDSITRETLILSIVRMLKLDQNLLKNNLSPSYEDAAEISERARPSVWLAQQLKLINADATHFKPEQYVERQEAALVLYRVYHSLDQLKAKAINLLQKLTPSPLPNEPTATGAPNPAATLMPNPAATPTTTSVATPTPTSVATPTTTSVATPTPTPVVTPTTTSVVTPTTTSVATPTPTPVATPTTTSVATPTPTSVVTPTTTSVATPTTTSVAIPTPTSVATPTATPAATPTATSAATPTPNPGPAFSVAESVIVQTVTIGAADSVHPIDWKLEYVLLDSNGQPIPDHQLPPDLHIEIDDNYSVFASDGTLDHFYNIPRSGSAVHGNIQASSAMAGYQLHNIFQLTVEPSSSDRTEYFAISLLLTIPESGATTIDEMEEMRSLLATIDPNLHVTWAMDNTFVFDSNQIDTMKKVLEYIDDYEDEIGILASWPNNISFEDWKTNMNSWLYMFRYNALRDLHVGDTNGDPSVLQSIPERYRPKSLATYAINPEQATWLNDHFGIDSYMGWPTTQYNVGFLSADGSPLMPYYSHLNNPMVPAQSADTNSGLVFMNTSTIDPIGSRYLTGASRWTLQPSDPYVAEQDAMPQLHIASQYLNNPFRSQNTINYLSLLIDTSWIMRTPNLHANWTSFIDRFPKDADVKIRSIDQLAELYKQKAGGSNNDSEFTLMYRGSGYATQPDGEQSPANLRYLWTETLSERIILAKTDGDAAWKVIDFTDYTITPIPTLPYTTLGSSEDISFVTGRSYKVAPNEPLKLAEIERIKARLIEIRFNEDIFYN